MYLCSCYTCRLTPIGDISRKIADDAAAHSTAWAVCGEALEWEEWKDGNAIGNSGMHQCARPLKTTINTVCDFVPHWLLAPRSEAACGVAGFATIVDAVALCTGLVDDVNNAVGEKLQAVVPHVLNHTDLQAAWLDRPLSQRKDFVQQVADCVAGIWLSQSAQSQKMYKGNLCYPRKLRADGP